MTCLINLPVVILKDNTTFILCSATNRVSPYTAIPDDDDGDNDDDSDDDNDDSDDNDGDDDDDDALFSYE
jgi:hypothetical protein